MAIKITFDESNVPQLPTLVLATRSGRKIGKLEAEKIVVSDSLNGANEIVFDVYKVNCSALWDDITDFKLIWCKEWNSWFEISVDVDENEGIKKTISGRSLGESELSQLYLYNININTTEDIERSDYIPTVLYNESNPKASLLNRIMEKCSHYTIGHVDFSIANIQRTFSFDKKTIYDAFQEIAQEINCLFALHCYSDGSGKLVREVNVYDLESYCLNCGERGDFSSSCNKCGSTDILTGYGENTGIFVTTENLAEGIKYTTDVGSVKNCFRLEAGDDLMTATIANCNPNGSSYIWYISDETKKDMSNELVQKIEDYDEQYEYYQNNHEVNIDASLLSDYNDLIEKYSVYSSDHSQILSPIVGYPALMESLYNTIDFYLYLNNTLMPDITIPDTSALLEAEKLVPANLSPVAVQSLRTCSSSTAESAVLSMAKIIVDSRYQVKASTASFLNNVWTGNFIITSYSDENDTATSNTINVAITDDYEKYVEQKIDKVLSKSLSDDDVIDIVQIFKLPAADFRDELKKYSLSRLNAFHDSCQSCIDILIQQGIADDDAWASSSDDLYTEMYVPYYEKLEIIEEEIMVRESEIAVIVGVHDSDGSIVQQGLQNALDDEKNLIQSTLNFENYLGTDLWLEFISYSREDTYSNSNYISDGLDNSEIFSNALEFINVAKKEIYSSATLQHSIASTLKNLLVMREFSALEDYFEVGNWIRVRVDNKIYKLRILSYEIDFENLENISITFSDVVREFGNVNDSQNAIENASSMATSYNTVSRQASQGARGNEQLNDWVTKGLALTKMKIIDNANDQNITWDNHGLLCKEYLPITDEYDNKQLKLINRGLYLTDDNWRTSRAGIGDFTFWNPETGQMEESYGVIADTLIGKLILSEKVGIYNRDNSLVLGEDGLVITADTTTSGDSQIIFNIQKKELDGNNNENITQIMYIDSDGNLVLNGSVRINSVTSSSISTLDEITDPGRLTEAISQGIYEEIHGENGVYSAIDSKYDDAISYTTGMLESYKSELGQYITYGDNGLTLGASSSSFKTVIDNQRLAFYDGNSVAAYISNNQLFIPNAVIQQTLSLGNFFFSPRSDGGVSLTWQGN